MVYFASFSLFCLFFLFLLPLIANKVDLEALERIRGFSTTMRYINRHYLSIYLSYLKLCACIDIGKGDIDPPLLGILCTFVNILLLLQIRATLIVGLLCLLRHTFMSVCCKPMCMDLI